MSITSKRFSVEIIEATRELTKREKVFIKVLDSLKRVDEELENGDFEMAVTGYVHVRVHNENSSEKEYEKIIIMDDIGFSYITGSKTFIERIKDIWEDMEGEPFYVKVFQRDSKKYSGKKYITWNIV